MCLCVSNIFLEGWRAPFSNQGVENLDDSIDNGFSLVFRMRNAM